MGLTKLAAVVPIKSFAESKTRLCAELNSAQRAHLARAMAEDVFSVIARNAVQFRERYVCSDDREARALAQKYDLMVLPDAGALNETITLAARCCEEQGLEAMLVAHGDLPFLNSSDLGKLIRFHYDNSHALSIAPDRSGAGSNLLLCSLPSVTPFLFGENSCQRHLRAAREANLRCGSIRLRGAELDIDDGDDLRVLRLRCQAEKNACGMYTCSSLAALDSRPQSVKRR